MISRRLLILLGAASMSAAIGTIAISSPRYASRGESAAVRAPQTSPTISPEIAKLRDEWAKDLHTKQLEQIANLYTEDAQFLLSNGTRVSGRPAIRELCKNVMATMTSEITFHTVAAELSGNLAFDSGDFSESLTAVSDGKKTQSTGAYVMLFKRQANGTWLIAEQVWTGTEPDIR